MTDTARTAAQCAGHTPASCSLRRAHETEN